MKKLNFPDWWRKNHPNETYSTELIMKYEKYLGEEEVKE